MIRSLVLPGWGQFYNEEPLKGLFCGAFELGLLGTVLYENDKAADARAMYMETGLPQWENSYDYHSGLRRDFVWYTAGAWLLGMLDAYVDAYLFSFEAENRKFEGDAGLSAGLVFHF
jgi:hypothetical protein